MKEKNIKILILFLICIISICSILSLQKPQEYKVLKVIEADELVIDINKNNKIDNNEKIKLKNIVAFKPIKNNINQQKEYNDLILNDKLKVGYLARKFANNLLLGKNVKVLGIKNCPKNEICKVEVFYQNKNYSDILLENGLGYISRSSANKKHANFFNFYQIKNNALELSKAKFYIQNINSKIIHELTCEHSKDIHQAELLSKKDISTSASVFCKKCLAYKMEKIYSKITFPKSKNTYNKSIMNTFDEIDLYLINPLEYKLPSAKCRTDFCKRLIKEIDSSKESIDIALYNFGNQQEIYDTLKKAKNRGVKIRAVANEAKKIEEEYLLNSKFIEEFSANLDDANSLMHNKFFIFDNKIVMSGSANISSTGSGGYNSNSVVFIKNEEIIQKFKKEFEQMHFGKFSKNKTASMASNSKIDVYFSPKDNTYKKIIQPLILESKNKIYISAFYLTDNNLIEDLIRAKKHGVEILIILDATSANSFKKKVEKLRKNKIHVIIENWGGKNHEKTISIDDKILILGSCNFSKSGFYKNDENILIFHNPAMAKYYNDYFLYLFNSINKKYLITIPRAEGVESKNSCNDGIDNNFDGKIDSDDEACKQNAKI